VNYADAMHSSCFSALFVHDCELGLVGWFLTFQDRKLQEANQTVNALRKNVIKLQVLCLCAAFVYVAEKYHENIKSYYRGAECCGQHAMCLSVCLSAGIF